MWTVLNNNQDSKGRGHNFYQQIETLLNTLLPGFTQKLNECLEESKANPQFIERFSNKTLDYARDSGLKTLFITPIFHWFVGFRPAQNK